MESTSMLHCKDLLQEQLLKAKESLNNVDSNLKKFVSRPSLDNNARNSFNKNGSQLTDKWRTNREESNFKGNFRRRPANVVGDDIENIPVKRRLGPKVLHSSLSGPPRKLEDYEDEIIIKKPSVSSCVIAKPHLLPPRKEALAVKTYSETRARDRRMFGALMGTLQKFRQEETQLKDKEDKKAQVEKKLEDAARREKEKLRKERQKLMDLRKQREAYIRAVENNMKLVKEQEQWEEIHQPLFNYIQTETKPVIYYLPKEHNETTSELLELCKVKLKKFIDEKREGVQKEVETLIEQYENVNVAELLEPEPELQLIRTSRCEENEVLDNGNRDHNTLKDNISSKKGKLVNNRSLIRNRSFHSHPPEKRKVSDSFKEQRGRKKEGIPVKEEKFDHDEIDYDDELPVKEETTIHHSEDEDSKDGDTVNGKQLNVQHDEEMKNECESTKNEVDDNLPF